MSDLVVVAHDGIELAVRDDGGDGPDLLFLHGAQRTLEDWAPVLAHLSGVRTVAMDLRSHGRSGVPEMIVWDDFVRDVDSVVEHLALADPLVVGHSFGGMLATAHGAAHPDTRGVINIDGFDFRERELFDEVDPAEVDRFLEEFRAQSATFITPDAGDDAWRDRERASLQQLAGSWKIPHDVTAAHFDRSYVRVADGWERRPSNVFFDIVDAPDRWADPLEILRRVECPVWFVVCRPPGESGMFAEARNGLERHVRTIAAQHPNVRLETIDASHGVIFERPDAIAAMISSAIDR